MDISGDVTPVTLLNDQDLREYLARIEAEVRRLSAQLAAQQRIIDVIADESLGWKVVSLAKDAAGPFGQMLDTDRYDTLRQALAAADRLKAEGRKGVHVRHSAWGG